MESPPNQKYISKRPHRKSRKGCQTCKTRKLKCDENHPICGYCSRRDLVCTYASKSESRSTSREAHSDSSNNTTSEQLIPAHMSTRVSSISPGPQWKSRFELRLLHHYTTMTCRGLLSPEADPGTREIFMCYIPQMSFDNETLLKVILSLGALHLSVLTPHDPSLNQISTRYFSDAVAEYRAGINDETGDFGESPEIFLAKTVLICFRTSINVHLRPEMESTEAFYQDLLLWLSVSQGLTTLGRNIWPSFQGTTLQRLLESPKAQVLREDLLACLASEETSPFSYLIPPPESEDASEIAAYKVTVQLITWIYAAVTKGESAREVTGRHNGVAFCIPPRFVQLLQDRQPRAIVVIAHYMALMEFIPRCWWAPGVAGEGVKRLMTMVPMEWIWAFEWPLRITGSGVGKWTLELPMRSY